MNPINCNTIFQTNYSNFSQKKRAQEEDEAERDLTERKKSKIFSPKIQFPFVSANSEENKPEARKKLAEELKVQAELIEEALIGKILESSVLSALRGHVKIVLQSKMPQEMKLAELGVFYFYLKRDKIFLSESYFSFFVNHLKESLLEIKRNYKQNCPIQFNGIFPSGKVSFLYAQFSELIIPIDGSFNLGGGYAILECLNSGIGFTMTEDNRKQVASCVKKLLTNQAFRNLLLKDLKLHPHAERIFRLDLKMPKEANVSSIHIKWNLLQALFFSIGQINEKNCYTVACLFNFLEEKPEFLLELIREVLETGTFNLGGMPLNIPFLLSFRKAYEREFSTQICQEDFLRFELFSSIREMYSPLPAVPTFDPNTTKKIEEWIEIRFGEEAEEVKEAILSYKLNYVQQIMFTILQGMILNSKEVIPEHMSRRQAIFLTLYQFAFEELKSVPNIGENLKRFFSEFLPNYFFLMETQNNKYLIKDGRIIFPFHSQGFDLQDLKKVFSDLELEGMDFNGLFMKYAPFAFARCLYYLNEEGNFERVEKISEFQKVLKKLYSNYQASKSVSKIEGRIVESYLGHSKFRQALAKALERSNLRETKLNWSHYASSDSFFLVQTGAQPKFLLQSEKLRGAYSDVPLVSKSVIDFFHNLCKLLSDYQKKQGAELENSVLVSNMYHLFNFQPYKFKKFINEPAQIEQYINKNKFHLDTYFVFTDEMKEEFFEELYSDAELTFYLSALKRGPMTARQFCLELSRIDPKGFSERLYDEVDFFVRKQDLKENYSNLLRNLESIGAKLTKEDEALLAQQIKEEEPYSLGEAAKLIQKFLAKKGYGLFPIYVLEQKIGENCRFPAPVVLGNLNWIMDFSEKFAFKNLILKYHLGKETWVLCTRCNITESYLGTEFEEGLVKNSHLFLKN